MTIKFLVVWLCMVYQLAFVSARLPGPPSCPFAITLLNPKLQALNPKIGAAK